MSTSTPVLAHTQIPTPKRRLRLKKTALSALILVSAGAFFSGCASDPRPSDYAAERPTLDLRDYFNGDLVAHGIFTDRAGKVVRRFTVQMKCTW